VGYVEITPNRIGEAVGAAPFFIDRRVQIVTLATR
jgi:hypothetical protein